MTTLFTFPGQGVQKAGMLAALTQQAETLSVLEAANASLGVDLLSIDNEAALKDNKNTQIALTVCGVAHARALMARGVVPDYVLGLSIGAFAAAIIAEVISLQDGLNLVAKRGELMAQAYPSGYGMAAIIGLSQAQVEQLIQQCQQANLQVYLANINTETQMIVSGADAALARLCEMAVEKNALSAKPLKVNVPSHCPLLGEQAEAFKAAFADVAFHCPKITVCSANKARVIYDTEAIKNDLIDNMARQVHWWETVAMLNERGVKLAIEMPPGDVLTRLCQASMPGTLSLAMSSETLDNMITIYQRASTR